MANLVQLHALGSYSPSALESERPATCQLNALIDFAQQVSEISDDISDNGALLDLQIEKQIGCCSLSPKIMRLQEILSTFVLTNRRRSLSREALTLLEEALGQVDTAYFDLVIKNRAEMASLQIPMINEASEKGRLQSALKQIVSRIYCLDVDHCNEIVSEILVDFVNHPEDDQLSELFCRNPDLESALRKFAYFNQPLLDRFELLQQEIYHASNHRIIERRSIVASLKRAKVVGPLGKFESQADILAIGWTRQPHN